MLFSSRFSRKTLGFALLELILVVVIILIIVAGVAFAVINFTQFGNKLLSKEQQPVTNKVPQLVEVPATRTNQIVINLSDDELQTIPASDNLLFSFNQQVKVATEWPTGNAGFLVKSYDGTNIVLLGYRYMKTNKQFADNGLDALESLDTYADKKIDEADIEFANLYVWLDENQNAIVEEGELHSLKQLGIKSIELDGVINKNQKVNQSVITKQGQFTREDGSKGAFVDISLYQNPYYREYIKKLPIAENAEKLPNIMGTGKVRDLQEAATASPDLYKLLVAYFETELADRRFIQMEDILFEWAKTVEHPFLENRLKSISTPKFDVRLADDLQFTKELENFTNNQKLFTEIMIIEAFTGQQQLHFFKKEILNPKQQWQLNLTASLTSKVIMHQEVLANQDGSRKEVLLAADSLKFATEQAYTIRNQYNLIVEDIFNKLQQADVSFRRKATPQANRSDEAWVDKNLQEQISTGEYFRKQQRPVDYPRRRHLSECVKPGNIIDQQVKDCAAGNIPKTW